MVNTSPEVRSSLEPGAFSMPFSPLQQAAVRPGPHKAHTRSINSTMMSTKASGSQLAAGCLLRWRGSLRAVRSGYGWLTNDEIKSAHPQVASPKHGAAAVLCQLSYIASLPPTEWTSRYTSSNADSQL